MTVDEADVFPLPGQADRGSRPHGFKGILPRAPGSLRPDSLDHAGSSLDLPYGVMAPAIVAAVNEEVQHSEAGSAPGG